MPTFKPSYVRELTEYPVGRRRLRYLLMAVLASLILNFEGQISPVVPLLLDDLGMTLRTYGLIAAVRSPPARSRPRSAAGWPTAGAGPCCWCRSCS